MHNSTALAPVAHDTPTHLMPAFSIQQATQRFNAVVEFVRTIMKRDVDFGVVPGTDKPTLLKPGAEKLTTFFGLSKRFQIVEKIEDWTGQQHGGEPFFYYLYRCQLFHGETLIAEADGSANSFESKYRWRLVREDAVPRHLNKDTLQVKRSSVTEFEFAINKAETGGKYGKPAEYWAKFQRAIEEGTAQRIMKKASSGKEFPAYTIESTLYRVPNEDITSQVNTLQKMSQKRALVAATLLAVNASEFFTQDVEDLAIDAEFEAVPEPQTTGNGHSQQPTQQAAGWDDQLQALAKKLNYDDAGLLAWLKKRFKLSEKLTTVAAALEKLTEGQKSQAIDDFTAQLEAVV